MMDLREDIRFIFESSSARLERINKRLVIIIILLIIGLVGSNAYWVYYESQFQDVITATQTVEQEADDGGSNTVGDFIYGDYNGKAESNSDGN